MRSASLNHSMRQSKIGQIEKKMGQFSALYKNKNSVNDVAFVFIYTNTHVF